MKDIEINWDEMRSLEMPRNKRQKMYMAVNAKEELTFSPRLVSELKMRAETLCVDIQYCEDYVALAIKKEGDFRVPKNGRMKHRDFAKALVEKGYKLPVKYEVEWSDKQEAWIATVEGQEVISNVRDLVIKKGKEKMRTTTRRTKS